MMRRSYLFVLFMVWLLCGQPSFSATSENTVSQAELAAQKELLQTQIEATKTLHQKDADAINKRIDDQLVQVGQGVDRFGVIAAVLGTLVSLLLAGLGLLGYVTVNKKTKVEAETAARDWFNTNEQSLKQRLSNVENLAADVLQKMRDAQHGVDQQAKDVHGALDRLQANMGTAPLDQLRDDASDVKADIRAVEERAQQLEKAPESSYSFEDWNTRGQAAFSKKAFDEAAYLWLKASQIPNAGAANVAQVLFNRGVAQGQLKQSEAAIATYDEVIRRFGGAPEEALRMLVARALANKGVVQGELKQSDAAIASFDELIHRLGEAPEAALRKLVARALVNKGVAQGQLKQFEAEVATYDELIRRFGEAPEAALRELVAKALGAKGVAHGELEQSEAAIASFDELINRFDEVPGAALHEQVARALVNKGFTQRQQNQFETAIATYDEVIRRFGEVPDLALRELVARALLSKSVAQGQLKQSEAEDATYDEVIRRFGQAPEAALRELVAEAWNGKGFLKLLLAKACWTQAPEDAQQFLSDALNNLGQAIEHSHQASGMVWGNRAYVRYLQGDAKGAHEDFVRALQAEKDGGKTLYEATLKDLDMHPVAEDMDLRVLLQVLWQAHSNDQQCDVGPQPT